MGFVSRFEYDVFISYSHRDNQTATDDAGRWVSRLHTSLRVRLDELLGGDVKIWRDPKLDAADLLAQSLAREIGRSAVFVPIVSPSYRNSEWCARELAAFRKATDGGAARVGDKTRIVKVVKTPLDDDEHKRILPDAVGCEFFEASKDTGKVGEFDADADGFAQKVEDLAKAIKSVLLEMRKRATVYLGPAPPSLVADRTKLLKELQARGYLVLPDARPPTDNSEESVRNALKQSSLWVHFHDGSPGQSTPGASEALEFEVAKGQDVERVVQCLGPPPSTEQEDSPLFGDKTHVLTDKGGEALKEAVLERLKDVQLALPQSNRGVRVYLTCNRTDHPVLQDNAGLKIRDYLDELGFDVVLPSADAGEADLRRDNKEKLRYCDAVLVYWQRSPDLWVDERWRELERALGLRKARPFRGTGLYITAAPNTPSKEKYKSREPKVIMRERGDFASTTLDPFVKLLSEPVAATAKPSEP